MCPAGLFIQFLNNLLEQLWLLDLTVVYFVDFLRVYADVIWWTDVIYLIDIIISHKFSNSMYV